MEPFQNSILFYQVEKRLMDCWHCQCELIWGGDHDIEDEGFQYYMLTNLSCPKCEAYVEVYSQKKECS